MRVDQFDFDLPEDRIALSAIEPRDAARLLVVAPGRAFADRIVSDLPDLLQPGDALVLNDTKVIAAALDGQRTRGGVAAKVAFNLIKRMDAQTWRALARPAKRLQAGDLVHFARNGATLDAVVAAKGDAGAVDLSFTASGVILDAAIDRIGDMPLPPYIALKRKTDAADAARYQTVFAEKSGAVAAPTAGLHMTTDLLDRLVARGLTRHTVTLHVGAGTFLPVKSDDTRDHVMHGEWGEITADTADALNTVRARGGRIVAIGTTALRVLESATDAAGMIRPFSGETEIFITPGYRFRAVDVLMTNFHLPRSTLFMLVAAFSGLETMRGAYAHAITSQYRFYSYGDGSLLFRG